MTHRLQRHQLWLYLAGLAVGALVAAWPGVGGAAGVLVEPLLFLVMLTTFLAVPFGRLREGWRDRRLLAAALLLNFVAVPLVVFGLSRFVAHDAALSLGLCLVLLAPCVDYVVPFTAAAGGAADKLLALAPLQLLLQAVAIPPLLALLLGPEAFDAVQPGPFVRALLLFLVLPLALAWLLQTAAVRWRAAARAVDAGEAVMVPALAVLLASIVASQLPALAGSWGRLLPLVPLYLGFAAVMLWLAAIVARRLGLGAAEARAAAMTAVVRNSLVVLPLALALPPALALAAPAVVLQTLVELVLLVVLVPFVRRAFRDRSERVEAG